MSRCKAGSKAAERRLRKHREALEKLAAITAQRQEAEARLCSQEAARRSVQAGTREAYKETVKIQSRSYRGDSMTVKERAAEFDAELAAKERAKSINQIVRDYRTRREERAALAAEKTTKPLPSAKPQPTPYPDAASGRPNRNKTRATIRATQPGLWEIAVATTKGTAGSFTLPFYQNERPEPQEIAAAVREEITRRMSVAAAQSKPRKQKARAARSPEPRDTALIRRIERQMEGV